MLGEKAADLTALIAGIRSHPGHEEEYITSKLRSIKREIQNGSRAEKSEAVLKLWYLHMLGYDVSWVYFAILEVMSLPTYGLRRPGFLACACCFSADTPVALLTINLFKKLLLQSADSPTICLTLSCVASMTTVDVARDLYSDVQTLLAVSGSTSIRCRAVLCLFRLFLKYPPALLACYPRLRALLEEGDTHVAGAAASVVLELALRNAKNYVRLAPILYTRLNSPLTNWGTLKIMKLLAALCPLESRLPPKFHGVLADFLQKPTLGRAVEYEILRLVLERFPSSAPLVPECLERLRNFYIRSADLNLRLLGLRLLASAVESSESMLQVVSARFASATNNDPEADLLSQVLTFVSSPDAMIRSLALTIVQRCVNAENFLAMCETLLRLSTEPLKMNHAMTETASAFLLTLLRLGERNRFHRIEDLRSYIGILIRISCQTPLCQEVVQSLVIQLARLVEEMDRLRPQLLHAFSIILFAATPTSRDLPKMDIVIVSRPPPPPPPPLEAHRVRDPSFYDLSAPFPESPVGTTAANLVIVPATSGSQISSSSCNRIQLCIPGSAVCLEASGRTSPVDSSAVPCEPHSISNASVTTSRNSCQAALPEEKAPILSATSAKPLDPSLPAAEPALDAIDSYTPEDDFCRDMGTAFPVDPPHPCCDPRLIQTVIDMIGLYHSCLFPPFSPTLIEDTHHISFLTKMAKMVCPGPSLYRMLYRESLIFDDHSVTFPAFLARLLLTLARNTSGIPSPIRCRALLVVIKLIEDFALVSPLICTQLRIPLATVSKMLESNLCPAVGAESAAALSVPSLKLLLSIIRTLASEDIEDTTFIKLLRVFKTTRDLPSVSPPDTTIESCPDLRTPFGALFQEPQNRQPEDLICPPEADTAKNNITTNASPVPIMRSTDTIDFSLKQSIPGPTLPSLQGGGSKGTNQSTSQTQYNSKLWDMLVGDDTLAVYYSIVGRDTGAKVGVFHDRGAGGAESSTPPPGFMVSILLNLRCEVKGPPDVLTDASKSSVRQVFFRQLDSSKKLILAENLRYRSKKKQCTLQVPREAFLYGSGNGPSILCGIEYMLESGEKRQLLAEMVLPTYHVLQAFPLDEDSAAILLKDQRSTVPAKAVLSRLCRLQRDPTVPPASHINRVVRALQVAGTMAGFHALVRPASTMSPPRKISALLTAREWSPEAEALEGLLQHITVAGQNGPITPTTLHEASGVILIFALVSCWISEEPENNTHTSFLPVQASVTVLTRDPNLSERLAAELLRLIETVLKGLIVPL